MDILEQYGIKIPNAVLIKPLTHDTEGELIDFLKRYAKPNNIKVITEPGVLQDTMVVEFESGDSWIALRQMLPYTYQSLTKEVTYEILELSTVCSGWYGELKTKEYLCGLRELAKLTGQDYTGVLMGAMSLLGQSINELGLKVKTCPEAEEDKGQAAPSMAIPVQSSNSATTSSLQGTTAANATGGLPPPPTIDAQRPRPPPIPPMSLPDLNPPGIQRYVVEHIVKSDDSALNLSAQRLRSFSGRIPRPPHESDYEAWRSGVDLLLKDPAVSDLQRSRKILESLFPPAANMVRHLMPDTTPTAYLQILDSAYGTVQDGDELYAKFMELFQDTGERPSAYLQRLQVALNLAVKRGGVPVAELDRHLLNQFCRGCWDNTLISELQLKQRKSHPPSFAELLLQLRTEEDREAAKAQRMKQHLGSRARAGAHAHYASVPPDETKVDELTTITRQLSQQLADIQRQLDCLAAQSNRQPTTKPTHASRLSEGTKHGKAISRSSHKASSTGPKAGYCYNCGEDGHIRPKCDNDPNPSLVAMKKRQLMEKQKTWAKSTPHSDSPLN